MEIQYYPLSTSQFLIFSELMKNPDITEYNQFVKCMLPLDVDIDRLAVACESIYRKRPELRTRFKIIDGSPVQYIDNDRLIVKKSTMTNDDLDWYLKVIPLKKIDILSDAMFDVEIITTNSKHCFLVRMHHIIADGITFSKLFAKRDINSAYLGNELTDQPYGQVDMACQDHDIDKLNYQRAKEFFSQKFKGLHSTHLTCVDGNTIGNIISHSEFISREEISRCCSTYNTSPNILCMLAFSYVLSSFSGEWKVVFAMMNHGRFNRKYRDSYGMYVNLSPMVVEIGTDTRLKDLFFEISNDIFDIQYHHHYPYNVFCKEQNIKPSITFNYQGPQIDHSYEVGDVNYEASFCDKGRTISDLSIIITERTSSLEIKVEANDSLYSYEYVKKFTSAIKNAINFICQKEIEYVSEIELITEIKKEELIEIGYGGSKDIDHNKTVVHRICEQSKITPYKVAVADSSSCLTYEQLDSYSNRIARELLLHNVKPNDFVILLLDRKKEFPLSVLAIHKAGAAYIPIDIEYPQAHISFIIKDSKAKVVITSFDVMKETGIVIDNSTCVLYIEDFLKDKVSSLPTNKSCGEGIAYMIYTSGTTGQSKGAMITHRNLCNFVDAVVDMENLTCEDRISGHRSFAFDAHIEDMFPILTIGGSFHIMHREIRRDIYEIRKFIEDNHITGGGYSTAIAKMLIKSYPELPIRFITGGGEKMMDVYSDNYEIINVYGPTECTDDTSYYRIKPGTRLDEIPIGRPIINSWNFIVSQYGRLLPKGIPGELCIFGSPVGIGYFQREELTKKSFVGCPYFPEEGKMYKTGDVCKWNDENQLVFLCRKDSQLNLNGYRIEIDEIESKLLKLKTVKSCCVDVQEYNNQKFLRAFYVADSEYTSDFFVSILEKELPSYMIPSSFERISSIPLTENGKIDRKKLPQIKIERSADYQPPTTDNEEFIVEGFTQVLNIEDPISINDSFWQLGGDSIKAIYLVNWIKSRGFSVSISEVFAKKTPKEIAKSIYSSDKGKEIGLDGNHNAIFPSPILEHFIHTYNTLLGYNQIMLLKVTRKTKIDVIVSILQELLQCRITLRTYIEDGTIKIQDASHLNDAIEIVKVSSYEEIKVHSSIQEKKPFSERSILVRICVYIFGDDTFISIVANHMIIDAISWNLLISDIDKMIASTHENVKKDIYSQNNYNLRYGEILREYLKSDQFVEEERYWKKYEDKYVTNRYSYCKNRISYSYHPIVLDKQKTSVLTHECCATFRCKPSEILLTAICRSYCQLLGYDNINILMEGHGRNISIDDIDITNAIGWHTSLVPIHVDNLAYNNEDISRIKIANHKNRSHEHSFLLYCNNSGKFDLGSIYDLKFNYIGNIVDASFREIEICNIFSFRETPTFENQLNMPLCVDIIVVDDMLNILLSASNDIFTHGQIVELSSMIIKEIDKILIGTNEHPRKLEPCDFNEHELSSDDFERIITYYSQLGLNVSQMYSLSPIQEEILFSHIDNPNNNSYRLLYGFELNEHIGRKHIEYAAEKLFNKHSILNSNIIYRGLTSYRQVVTDRKPNIEYIGKNSENPKEILEEIRGSINSKSIDLESDPLFSVYYIEKNDSKSLIAFSVHHILVDGWSSFIFMRDFFRFLNLSTMGAEGLMNINELYNYSYEDYVRSITKKVNDDAQNYWKKLLDGYKIKAIIPYYGNSDVESHNDCHHIECRLTESEVNIISGYAQRKNISLSTIIELTWALLLQEYNNSNDVVFGKVVSGRKNAKFHQIVGPFINTIPVRLTTDGDMSIVEAAKQLQEQYVSSAEWEDCSLQVIQRNTVLGTDLFQSILVFDNIGDMAEIGKIDDCSWQIKPIMYESESYCDLSILVYYYKKSLVFRFQYDNRLYSKKTISDIAETFLLVLKTIVSESVILLSEIKYTSEKIEQELIDLGKGASKIWDSQTIIPSFVRIANTYPDKEAVVAENGILSYKELDLQSNALANKIRHYNFSSQLAVILLDRHKEFPLVVFGILKAGYSYLPIDPQYPLSRIEMMIKDSQSNLLITTHAIFDGLLNKIDSELEVIYIDDWVSGYNSLVSDENPVDFSNPDSVAYMIYTSGSTSRPKGVLISHSGLNNFIHSSVGIEGLTPNDKISAYRSFSFDAHIIDIFPVLITGGTLYIMPSSIRKDITQIYEYIVRNNINGCGFTTPITCLLLNTYPDLPVRFITGGGDRMKGVYSDTTTIINLCGPTECTDDYTYYVMPPRKRVEEIPIGRPINNLWVFIVDKHGQLAPNGAVGEICVAGVQVGNGYWNNPEETRAKFVRCPFLAEKTKMYRTGDYGRWNNEGQLMFIGRIDKQIKVNGYRVDIGEIETNVALYPVIKSSCVKIVEHNNTKQINAYFTSNEKVSIEELKAFLSARIPHYLMPTNYVQLEIIPLTPNGKVDYGSLPEVGNKKSDRKLPISELEKLLCRIFEDILNVDNICINDNLLEYGLSSLDAMNGAIKMMNKGLKISPTQILSNPIVSSIEKIVAKYENSGNNKFNYRFDYPLMDNQMALYLEWEKDHTAIQYNSPSIVEYEKVSGATLRAALVKVIEYHPVLLTRIKIAKNEPRQFIGGMIDIKINHLKNKADLEHVEGNVCPFDLLGGPLCRLEIYEDGADSYLFMDVHHIIFDGISRRILLSDINKILNGGEIPTEKKSVFQYAKEKSLYSEEEAKEYYSKYEDYSIADTYPVYGYHSSKEKSVQNELTKKFNVSHILEYCRRHTITTGSYFIASFMYTLHCLIREKAVSIALVTSGRNDNDILNSIGMFANVLPVIGVIPEKHTLTFNDYIHYINKIICNVEKYSSYPFFKLTRDHNVKPNIMFAYQDKVDGKECIKTPSYLDRKPKAPLCVTISIEGSEVLMSFEYDESIYEKYDILSLASAYYGFCSQAYIGSYNYIEQIPFVCKRDIEEILRRSKGEIYNIPDCSFIDLFNKAVDEYPMNMAVADGESQYTYHELDAFSNVISNRLLALDIPEDSFVGVALNRKKEYVLSILSIFKIGAAFVPIDIDMPIQRIKFIVNDAKISYIISSRNCENTIKDSGVNIIYIEDLMTTDKSNCTSINLSSSLRIAYMIYTSGTSGNPKGVMISHYSLVSFIKAIARTMRLTDTSRIFCYSSFSFDASIEDILPVLTVGGATCIVPDNCIKDMAELYNFLKCSKATGGSFPTQFGQVFLNNYKLPLEYVDLGGEKMTMVPPHSGRLFNTYGPTEFTVIGTIYEVGNKSYKNIPIGFPIDNCMAVITDDNGNLLPAGAPGELCLSGYQLSKGYQNNENLNKEKFIINPFVNDEPMFKMMYRTGDLCRINENNEIEFLGRIDNQIKLRGYRIEVGEIEQSLLKHRLIKSACVVMKNHNAALPVLCCYYTSLSQISDVILKDYLSELLPEYMIPSLFQQLDVMPLTINGKIDVRKLPEPRYEKISVYKAPTTSIERVLCKLMSEILEMEQWGIDDDFVLNGGNSIKIMQLQNSFNSDYAKMGHIDFRTIFKYRTPREIAYHIKGQSIVTDSEILEFSLSEMQIMHFETCKKAPGMPIFNIPILYRLDEKTDLDRLSMAINNTIENHPIFSTQIICKDDNQVIQKQDFSFRFNIEVEIVSDDDFEKLKCKLVQPFDLEKDKLIRVRIFQTKESKYLFMDIHHIIFDGVSSTIFFRDISDAYLGKPLKKEESNFLNYVKDEKIYQNGIEHQEALDWYESILKDTPKRLFPTTDINASLNGNNTISSAISMPIEIIEEFSNNNNISLNTFMTAAFGLLLMKENNVDRVGLVAAFNGRDEIKYENSIGVFAYPVFAVCEYNSDQTVLEYLHIVNQNILRGMSSCHISMNSLSKKGIHLRDYMQFLFHGESEEKSINIGNIKAQQLPLQKKVSSSGLPMTVHIEKKDRLIIRLRYNTSMYSENRIMQIVDEYESIVSKLLSKDLLSKVIQ